MVRDREIENWDGELLHFLFLSLFMLSYLCCTVGIRACMEVTGLVDEVLYEIDLDNQGCNGGPKAGRLRALANVNILSLHFMFFQVHEISFDCQLE